MLKRFLASLAVSLAIVAAEPAAAHPLIHIFCRVLFNFDGGAVNAFGQTWTFEKTYSRNLLDDFDTNGDGALSRTEVAAMEKTVLPTLARSNYFTFVSVDGRDLGPIKPYTFNAVAENGIVTFAMSVQLPAPIDPGKSRLTIEIRDPGYSVEAAFVDADPVALRNAPDPACAGSVIAGSAAGTEAATLTCPAD